MRVLDRFPALGAWLLICSAIATGCATPPRPPKDLDLARAVIISDPTPPVLTVAGPTGKGAAAGAGAVKGGGTGLTLGTLACLGTGFLFPICVATVVPASAAIGAAGWAAVAAVRAEGAEGMALQSRMLAEELDNGGHVARLAEYLQEAAREQLSIELPIVRDNAAPDAGDWTIEISLLELASDTHSEGQAYSLWIEGRLRLRRGQQVEPVYERRLEAGSDIAMTTQDWTANDGAALHAALDRAVRSLAVRLMSDLAGARVDRRAGSSLRWQAGA
jgi:hypothetical protein